MTSIIQLKVRMDKLNPNSDDHMPCKIVVANGVIAYEGTNGGFKALLKLINGKTRSI